MSNKWWKWIRTVKSRVPASLQIIQEQICYYPDCNRSV